MPDPEILSAAAVMLFLGAASPGPSLVVVARNTAAGGRSAGAACAFGHGIGFGLYALLAVLGLSALMQAFPGLFTALQILGAALLLYLAWSLLTAPSGVTDPQDGASPNRGFLEGFLIAFLNPKIALFFIGVLSAVLADEVVMATQFSIAALGWLIDTGWYLTVALALSTGPALSALRRLGRPINSAMAVLLVALAATTLWRLLKA